MNYQETLSWLIRVATWLIPAIVGGYVCLSKIKNLTRREKIEAWMRACGLGYLANLFCIWKGWHDSIQFVSGFTALLSEIIVQFISNLKIGSIKKVSAFGAEIEMKENEKDKINDQAEK